MFYQGKKGSAQLFSDGRVILRLHREMAVELSK
jgi:hypothetical protein